MAIDASIPLSGKSFAPPPTMFQDFATNSMKLAQMGQQIQESKQNVEHSKAAQALTEAQTPGVAADSAVKQRALAFNQWASTNKDKFTDEAGNVDVSRFIKAAASNGFNNEAQTVAANDLQVAANKIKNTTDQQTQQVAAAEYTGKAVAHTANLLEGADPKVAAALLRQYADFNDKMVPGSGQQIATAFAKTVTGPDGQPKIEVDMDKVRAVNKATMTSQEQQKLALEKRQMAVNERNISLAEHVADPQYVTQISDIQGAPARVDDIKKAIIGDAKVNYLNDAIHAADELGANYPTAAGTIAQNVWETRVKQGGSAQKLESALTEYNTLHGTNFSVSRDGIKAIKGLLNTEAVNAARTAGAHRVTAASPTASGAVNAAPKAVEAGAEPTKPAETLKAGAIKDGLPVLTGAQAAKLNKGTKYYGTDGVKREKN